MHLAVNLPAGVDYSARAFLARRRTRVTVAVSAAALAALLAALPAGQGRASNAAAPAALPAAAALAPAVPAEQPAPAAASELPPAASAAPTPAPAAPVAIAAPGDLVTRVVIPRVGVDHAVERVGVDADGTMESPRDGVRGVGWYAEWATPGRGGNAVFSAHETWDLQRGPFYSLRLLQPGDTLTLRMRSGAEYRYVVFSNRRYPVETLPLGDVIWPPAQPGGEEWATFITCGGRYVRRPGGYWDYLDRDVIVARRLG